MVTTFLLSGGLIRFLHLVISGSWFCRMRMVFGVAVAVIMMNFPPNPLSSPDDRAMAGRNALLDPLFTPQLATSKK
jgi:hypothetical protein